MALYVMGDPHLSLGGSKPMDIFAGWKDYVTRMEANWRAKVQPEDTVVVAGDISWAMTLEEARADFSFLHQLPGTKIFLKGNHDYWWGTVSKIERFLAEQGFDSIKILHNNCYFAEGVCICGSRGWLFDQGEPADQKVLAREAGRLQASIDAAGDFAGEKLVFLHYPPVYGEQISGEIVDVLLKNGIRRCYYGHIHGAGHAHAINGSYLGIEFRLIAADYLKFDPYLVKTD